MSSTDESARASVPHSASDYGAACRTSGLRVVVLLLIALFLLRLRLLALGRLLALCRLLALRLLLGRCRRLR